MANAKSIGWAIYAAGFVIWLFGYLSAGHASAFDWDVATPSWISSFVPNLEAELGLALMFASMIPIYWRAAGIERKRRECYDFFCSDVSSGGLPAWWRRSSISCRHGDTGLLCWPMRRLAGRCARAASGQATEPPSNVMTSRRLTDSPPQAGAPSHYHTVARGCRCASAATALMQKASAASIRWVLQTVHCLTG
jgi:hypothetical protein